MAGEFEYVPDPVVENNDSPTLGDYGKTAVASVTGGVLAPAAAAARAATQDSETNTGKFTNEMARILQRHLNIATDELNESRTEEARKRAEAAVTSSDFWEHPVSASMLKATGMSGPLAAAIFSGGPVGAALASGAMATGSYLNEIDKTLDAASDAELRQNNYYESLRSMGMDEGEARSMLKSKIVANKDVLNFAVGAIAGALGPAGKLAAGVAGKGAVGLASQEAGALARGAIGAAEGAVGGAAQGGVENATVQQSQIEAGLKKEFDDTALVNAVLEPALIGGVTGGIAGAAVGGKSKAKAEEIKARNAPEEVQEPSLNEVTAQPPKQSGSGVANPPVEAAPVGNPDSAPTRSETAYPKAEAAKAKGKGKVKGPTVETVEPSAPSIAEAAAIADLQQPRAPEAQAPEVPTPVAEAAQRVARPAQPEQPPVPAPVVAPEPAAPPEVAAASRRVEPQITPEVTQPQAAPDVRAPEVPAPAPTSPVQVEIAPTPPKAAVTPEPVKPVAPVEVTPAEPVKRPGRVLQVIKDKAAQEAETKANREAFRKANKNAKEVVELEANPEPAPKGKNWTKAEKEAREASAGNAKKIFDEHVPDDAEIPTTPQAREELRARLGKMIEAADAAGVKVPAKVGYEGTSDHVVYMRAAKDLHKKLGQKSFTGARRDKQIADFMVAERAAKKGDFGVLRETRKVEGDLAMRREQGDVEVKAAGGTAGAEAEAEPVHTAVPKSARGAVRDSGSENKAASPGKVLEGDAKAKAIAELNARMAKGKVDLAATRTEKPPEATSAKVVDKAAEKTNTSPTEAQKEAGNYAKATVKWHGMEIAIENPKGSVRKGKDANGKEWSVEMPDHYGYVKRSEGADGDQVDVYMGPHPDSDHVFVIHQQDFNGKFDEHKAMLGYTSNADALQAYDRAFSDGRGFERIKDIEIMTAQEFKDWVRSDKPKKAAKAGEEVLSEALTDTGVRNKFNSKKTVQALKTLKAKEALEALDLSHLTGVPKAMADLMLNRLKALVGDVDVHIVNKEQMAQASGDVATAFADDPLKGDRGLHNMRVADGKSDVFIRTDNLDNPEHTAHAVIHEIVHAATSRALYEDPKLAMTVKQMMTETKAHLLKHSGKEHYDELAAATKYAFTNVHEFVAEAMSNPKVQDFLATVPMSRELAAALRIPGQKMSLWDAFVHVVRKALEKSIGRVPQGERMIEGIVRLGTQFERAHLDVQRRRTAGEPVPVKIAVNPHALTERLIGEARDTVQRWAEDRAKVQDQEGKPWLLKARTMDQIAQAAEHYFGGNNPVRKVADTIEQMRVKALANLKKSEPIVDKLYSLEKKYKAQVDSSGKSMWEKFTTLVHDETMAGVFADRDLASQAHLGKDALKGKWAKAQHSDLASRFAELPEDLKAARSEAMRFFTAQQNAMSLGIIKNRVLKALGVDDDALARRIHEDRTTDADAATLGEQTLELIKEAKELSKIEGPYFPLMRRGNHVVRATYDVAAPQGAKKLSDNEFEFAGKDARDEAIAYAEKQDTRPEIKSVWVDPATGETHYPDGTKVTANDVQSEQRFRVAVQSRHVEFFETAREAQAAAYELAKQGLKVDGVEERRFEGGENRDLLSHQMATLVASLEKRKGYQDMTADQRRELKGALTEASIRFLGSTRIQSKRLPRRYVEGASNDLTRNTLDYAQSTAGYLAKLEHQPQLEAAVKEMRDAVTQDNSKNKSLARSSIANEIEERVAKANVFDEGGAWNSITKRVMTLSFMDKLFSPAFNIINSMQPAMVTMPTLAGRYGVGRSFDALSRAYRDVSGLGLIKAGVKDTIAKAKDGQAETTDLLSQIKRGLSSKERAMLDYLAERGSIDPEAGMEVSRLIKSRAGALGRLDSGLGYMEGIARQMPASIEMMNRSVTALATYRLELARGAGHEKAMAKAQETVNNTQGLYSATNTAPLFNHPVAKLSLQFKKYGQMMYHLIGSNIGKALRNAEPGERAEALKTLAGLTATHVAMAGALGLPTEPFKYLLMGAQAAGLTSTGWSDVEDKVRQTASNWFGKTGGEIITKGLPRALGIDLSSRVGLDSLSSFGEPRSNKEADVKKWMFDTVAARRSPSLATGSRA
ncbi:hypothetical protein CWO91_16490 [Bradyrhizobium genosp. SA-3]|uniref:PLxRFG domain-containing protein n=1 Tax=Bradyrhizobium genosp. SA-3 TaxID=508868 RepID=UPI001028F3E0|nr:PLxRFG domain-containing protein [Bradyrhizobium genosp. SA-3]RZN09626.1 hypothetical protein CWO91_16490 [Bradyrhizobium genosp. SA-3]